MYLEMPIDESQLKKSGKSHAILERRTVDMRTIRLKKRFPMIMEDTKNCKFIPRLVQC